MSPEHLVNLVNHHCKSARKCHHLHASRAHQDHPDHQVHLANLEHLAPTVNLADPERMAVTDHPAQPDPMEHLALQAKMAKRDHLVIQPPLSQPLPESPDPPEKTDPLDHLVKTAPLVQMAAPVPLETRAHLVLQDHLATTELQETKDHQAQMDPRENRVFAPNIAPPTAVSSSKTEQGDKRSQKTLLRICYSDEKPVIFMSIVAFIIFVIFNGQLPQPQQSTILNTAAASPIISFGAF